MQRKIGYGLIGASLTVLLFLGIGLGWRVSVQAKSDTPSEQLGNPMELVNEAQVETHLPPPSLAVVQVASHNSTEPINPVTNVEDESGLIQSEAADLFAETRDSQQVLKALATLAEREQQILIAGGGWYHFESTYFWGDDTLISANHAEPLQSSEDTVSIPHEVLIPHLAWSNSFIRYNDQKQVLEGISILGEYEDKAIKQLSIVDEGAWLNLTLQQAGHPQFRSPILTAPFTFPTQEQRSEFAGLTAYPDLLEVYAYTTKDGHYVIDSLFHFPILSPAPHDPSALAVSKQEKRIFEIATGRLLSRESYLILDNGQQDLILSESILAQQVIQTLPVDTAQLYEQTKAQK